MRRKRYDEEAPSIPNRANVYHCEKFDKKFYHKVINIDENIYVFFLGIFTSIVCSLLIELMKFSLNPLTEFIVFGIMAIFSILSVLFLSLFIKFCSLIHKNNIGQDQNDYDERNNLSFKAMGNYFNVEMFDKTNNVIDAQKFIKGLRKQKLYYRLTYICSSFVILFMIIYFAEKNFHFLQLLLNRI